MAAKYYTFNKKLLLVLFDNEGKPWFKAKDVATALKHINAWSAVREHVDDGDKLTIDSFSETQKQGVGPIERKTVFINEAGLCSLMLRSTTPEARLLVRSLLPEKFYLAFTNMKDEPFSSL